MYTLWKSITLIILLVVSVTVLPKYASAPVEKVAIKIDNVLAKIIQCESSGDPNAIGKAGEVGILQFMPKTFEEWKIKMGRPDLDINNSNDQIIVYQWAIKNNLAYYWTCWRLIFGIEK